MKKTLLSFFIILTLNLVAQQTVQLTLSNLPNQVNLNMGTTKIFVFDQAITSIISRNTTIADISIDGTQVTVTAILAGRTGLKITVGATSYMVGLRVNNADGSVPGLSHNLNIGCMSEDATEHLAFLSDIQAGLKNKQMDIRYIYLNGGVSSSGSGWRVWGANRVEKYCKGSLKNGIVPIFVYYNIPDAGEGYDIDVQHARDPEYMKGFFDDMEYFFQQANEFMQGDLYGIIIEPDFLGYVQQNAKLKGESIDPAVFPTAVGLNTIAANAGTLKTLVEKINSTINQKKIEGQHIIFGWMLNLWSNAQRPDGTQIQGTLGIIHRTDDLGFVDGRALIKESAEGTAQFAMDAGILSYGADFVAVDKYGLDAMGYMPNADPALMHWFWNNDHWNNYLFYVKTIHEKTDKPMAIWQIPIGHVNRSKTLSAYTNALFPDLTNVSDKYEDSAPTYFFGDTFLTSDNLRKTHFSKNIYSDTGLVANGNTIRWRSHMQDCADAGIAMALFGAGVGPSTDGIGTPPSDDYYFIQKVQEYYQKAVPITFRFTGENVGCNEQCSPLVMHIKPSTNDTLFEIFNGQSIQLSAKVYDLNGSITEVKTFVNSTEIANTRDSITNTALWKPTAFGIYTFTIKATDNDGNITTSSKQFIVNEYNPLACKVPAWQAIVYGTPTETSYNGNVYKNKWSTTTTDIPGTAQVWEYIHACGDTNIIVDACATIWIAKDYATGNSVAYDNKLYKNKWWATSSDVPGVSGAWVYQSDCGEGAKIEVFGTIYFGDVELNDTQTASFIIKNSGTAPLHITFIECPIGMSSNYTGTIAAGDSQNVIISFTPIIAQVYDGLIKINSDAVAGHYVRYGYGVGVVYTGIEEYKTVWSVYPNPAHGQLIVEAQSNASSSSIAHRELVITNTLGQIVFTSNDRITTKDSYKINVRDLPNGLYFLRITLGDNIDVAKFMKQ